MVPQWRRDDRNGRLLFCGRSRPIGGAPRRPEVRILGKVRESLAQRDGSRTAGQNMRTGRARFRAPRFEMGSPPDVLQLCESSAATGGGPRRRSGHRTSKVSRSYRSTTRHDIRPSNLILCEVRSSWRPRFRLTVWSSRGDGGHDRKRQTPPCVRPPEEGASRPCVATSSAIPSCRRRMNSA